LFFPYFRAISASVLAFAAAEILFEFRMFLVNILIDGFMADNEGLSPIKSPQATEKAAVRPPNCVHFAVAKRLILC